MLAVRRTLAAAFLVAIAASVTAPSAHGDDKTASPATTIATPAAAPSSINAPPPGGKITFTDDKGATKTCLEQAAQSFLIRGNWFPRTNDPEKVKEGRKLLTDAITYRTEKYGYFEGFGSPKMNPHAPRFYAKTTSFMGMTVQVHERIIPALKCVEAALKAGPAGAQYKPRAMGGMRFHNTYRGIEISNHVYGIAVDIEPDRNTCCGCVSPWPDHPLCKAKNKTVWERMAMPKSWVDTFERFGFYWLGHDVLQDTMHFEFLGDPDKVLESSLPAGAVASP